MKKSGRKSVREMCAQLHAGALVVLFLAGSVWAQTGDDVILLSPRGSMVRQAETNSVPVSLPFYVHNIGVKPPVKNFAASGYMGDVSCLRVMGGYTNYLQPGVPCVKVVYVTGGVGGWAGLVWQNPADNWGGKPGGGYNLSNAGKLEFSARGEMGGEVVEFKIGGTGGDYPDSATATTGPITLKKDWTRYVLDLHDSDLKYISSGFGFVVTDSNNPKGCTFYLDKIAYIE